MIPSSPFLCFITDESRSPIILARKALEGGASMIQLRNKSADGDQLYHWSVAIQALCRKHKAIFIVNDRVDIALAAGADGVHLGQQDLPADAARKLLGKDRIMGISVSSPLEALAAEKNGADYVGFGHIFPTSSKDKKNTPVGPESIADIKAIITIPIIAIGGITGYNAQLPIRAGAAGIAVIAAVSRAADPEIAARELVGILQKNIEHNR
ncbi:MAG: thiamine phosphate synthase [Chlorobium limicola]|uniref:thiamine phosphate synthase n=1 Tax=Chlorobium limicola TaxID=1092 RepID=UPI0023F55BE8|nr:thiamine phosphate synthase [Chlorobium limicola]NTV21426.1 thiamine phosphate synthase [Chlorobium limicola]